jgi:energy-coupling factor transporter ATP-binding protein EcfA2
LRPIVCRTLRREYRLHAPDAETDALLRFVAAEPDLPGIPLEPVDVPIAKRDGFLSATMPWGSLIEGTAGHLLGAMHRIVIADLAESHAGAPFVHGATVVVGGQRLLIVGHKGCGKSTFALHLALAGHDVEGDEHLVIGDHHVIARPRTLRIKEGSFALLPGLPPSALDSPSIVNWDGTIIRAISPSVGGRPWVIRPGRLAGIIFLLANHGGRSVARPIGSGDAFGRLMREIMLPTSGVAAATARLRRLVLETPTYQLLLGDLETAEWHASQVARLLT